MLVAADPRPPLRLGTGRKGLQLLVKPFGVAVKISNWREVSPGANVLGGLTGSAAMRADATPDEIIKLGVELLFERSFRALASFDPVLTAVYVTDAVGLVTYFNRACVSFAGRTPVCGKDRWCVSWKLYTRQGAFLPHADSPRAAAIRTRQPIRGIAAIAEKPDGRRINFLPFPTPVIGEDGDVVGALNVLADLSDQRQLEYLQAKATACRRLAQAAPDQLSRERLLDFALEFEDVSAIQR